MAAIGSTHASSGAAGQITQGGVTAVALVFIHDAIMLMVPFLVAAAILIVVDLYFGVQAARARNERITMSRGLRLTVNKVFEYACWVILSATLAEAFNLAALNWVILAIVFGNELISIATNWAEIHGKKVSGLREALLKAIGKKVDLDLEDIRIEEKEEKEEKLNDEV